MPAWGEWLPIDQRWDLVKFIVEGFQTGKLVTASVLGSAAAPDNYATYDDAIFVSEGGNLSPANGKALYG